MSAVHPELKAIRDRHPIDDAEKIHHGRLSRLDKIAVWLAKHTGEPRFFTLLACITTGWVLWNSVGPKPWRFDPLPGFPMLNGLSKVVQLCFLPLVLIGQNIESKKAKVRAEQARKAMLRDEEETQLVLEKLTRLEALLLERGGTPMEGSLPATKG
jgi:uncharacterized membrane protein